MTHDPMCPMTTHDPDCCTLTCRCDLIARVREDERSKTYEWPQYQSQRDRDAYAAGYAQRGRDDADAVKALLPDHIIVSRPAVIAAITALDGDA